MLNSVIDVDERVDGGGNVGLDEFAKSDRARVSEVINLGSVVGEVILGKF